MHLTVIPGTESSIDTLREGEDPGYTRSPDSGNETESNRDVWKLDGESGRFAAPFTVSLDFHVRFGRTLGESSDEKPVGKGEKSVGKFHALNAGVTLEPTTRNG